MVTSTHNMLPNNSRNLIFCPYCGKSLSANGGALLNHIARSVSCYDADMIAQSDGQLATNHSDLRRSRVSLLHPVGNHHLDGGDTVMSEIEQGSLPMPPGPAVATSATPVYTTNRNRSAGHMYAPGFTRWEQKRRDEDAAKPFAPWESKEEWEFVQWLTTAGISKSAIDRLLETAYVSIFLNITFIHTLTQCMMDFRPSSLYHFHSNHPLRCTRPSTLQWKVAPPGNLKRSLWKICQMSLRHCTIGTQSNVRHISLAILPSEM